MMSSNLTYTILMIKPTKFGCNLETAVDNVYQQKKSNLSNKEISLQAQKEYLQLVSLLKAEGVDVIEFIDDTNENTPDSLFPNNWISTHLEGLIYLYPMLAENRRLERRIDIVNYFRENFIVNNVIDDAVFLEKKGIFLEGTGSMVLDRKNKIAYACLSKRTDSDVFTKWCQQMNYQDVSFVAEDRGQAIYHTNVLMSVCQHLVFICLDAICMNSDKEKLLLLFKQTNKEVINISSLQMNSFLGNVLELRSQENESLLVMSSLAFCQLTDSQKTIINTHTKIIHAPLDTIEYFGGGSARCMIAEIFLEPNFSDKLKHPIIS